MGEVCICYSWTYRPVLPVVIILATITCMVHCSESAAAAGGKMYPRGNHWAVGHLMGKKSIESLPGLHDSNHDSDYPTPLERGDKVLGQYERPPKLVQDFFRALVHHKSQRQISYTANRLRLLRSGWREEDRDKYLREMSDLLLLALSLQDNGSN
ncbi:gastrin-releasing peptide [Centroberyx gerrardi]